MTWSARLLRGADDLAVRWNEPSTTRATLIVDTCGETGLTSGDVLAKLSASDSAFGFRIRLGLPAQAWDSSTSSWVQLDPVLSYGVMLVRTLDITEHEERADLWRVEYEASGFGPPLGNIGGNEVELGPPNITVSTASRPRTVNAYRIDDPRDSASVYLTFPDETPAEDADGFDPEDWETGTDIGGWPVDVNTSPVPVPIDQTVITVSYVARWHFLQWDGTYTQRTDLVYANELVGGRNLCEFMRYPVGTLLFESIDVQPLHHEFKAVTLVFVYDQWRHAQQVPLTLPQFSTPVLVNSTTGMSQTKTVLWMQPYLDGWCIDENTTWLADTELAYLAQFEAEPEP